MGVLALKKPAFHREEAQKFHNSYFAEFDKVRNIWILSEFLLQNTATETLLGGSASRQT